MRVFQTPGVYFERTDANAGGIASLRTDVAGFVGIAARGPLHLAVPVDSVKQFAAWFGAPFESGYLAYSARAFFENGGRRLWAVRVASEAAATASLLLGTAWRIEASSPGVWGNDLAVRVRQTRSAQARAVLAAHEPRRVRVGSLAGFGRHSLLELRQGAASTRALVREVDPADSSLLLDRDPVGLDPAQPARAETVLYSIEVYEAGPLAAVFADLSVVPEHARYAPRVLAQPWRERDPVQYFRVARERLGEAPPPIVVHELRDAAERAQLVLPEEIGLEKEKRLQGGADGLAALAVRDFIGEAVSPLASDAAQALARRGLRALEEVDEVSMLAVPDIHIRPAPPVRVRPVEPCEPDPCLPAPVLPAEPGERSVGDAPPVFDAAQIHRVQAAMIQSCEARRDRIALLDAPLDACSGATTLAGALRAWRGRFDSAFGALYAPWIAVVDPLRARPGGAARAGRLTRAIPPSGHVAGFYAATDLSRGVHVAGANAMLEWAQDTTLALDEERHGLLNALNINVLRVLPGRGLRLLGARTLSSDSAWRFVNVRRLMCMIGKALATSLQWAVFEPNDWRTRAKLALVAGSFLEELWRRGALAGASAAEAYFVRCDDANNPPEARARGELLLELGIAPSVPMEFVVLRIGRDANGLAISEPGAA
jgi:phage tail sheath protein FI